MLPLAYFERVRKMTPPGSAMAGQRVRDLRKAHSISNRMGGCNWTINQMISADLL